MNWRNKWILYWAHQLNYINDLQKNTFSMMRKAQEKSLEKFVGPQAILQIRYMFVLQCILQSTAKTGFISESLSNRIIQEKIQSFLRKDKNDTLSFPQKEAFSKHSLEKIISGLKSQNILKEVDHDAIEAILKNTYAGNLSIGQLPSKQKDPLLEKAHSQYADSTLAGKGRKKSTLTFSFPQTEFEQYILLEKLGEGGMGVVYKARDAKMKRFVAIKAMHKTSMEKESSLQRFYREIEISSQLNHPNLVKIYTVKEVDKIPYLIMEYIEGESLISYIKKEQPSLNQQLVILKKILIAIEHAHDKKILHRDIKPSNIIIRKDGEPVLMDFGLAKSSEVQDKSLTQSGEVIGTPQYMAPEQARGQKREFSRETDVYGVGAVFYHMLHGTPPATGDSLMDVLHQVISIHPSFSNDFPSGIRLICKKALEKKKKYRYKTAAIFSKDIQNYLEGKKTHAASFYKKQKLLTMSKYLSCVLFICLISYCMYLQITKKPSLTSQIYANYNQAIREKNIELAYIKLSRTLELITKIPRKKKKKFKSIRKKSMRALFSNYLKQGHIKTQVSHQEALIYYTRAKVILTKYLRIFQDASFIKQWELPLRLAILKSNFAAGNYDICYDIGIHLLKRKNTLEVKWITAVSSYHCGYHDTLRIFKQILKESMPGTKENIGSLYYQGILAYKKKSFLTALSKFTFAIKSMEKSYSFANSLYLYYIASKLVNFHTVMSKQELLEIDTYRKKIKDERIISGSFYKETLARYYLMSLKKKKNSILAKKVIELMTYCIKTFSQKAEYYYIRAKGYLFFKHYERALKDCQQAALLEPKRINPVLEQLKILKDYPKTSSIKMAMDILPRKASFFNTSQINIFEEEFEQLRKQYLFLKLHSNKGIAFSEKRFSYYYKNLFLPIREVQKSVIHTLSSMKPYKKIKEILAQKMKNISPSQKKVTKEVIDLLNEKIEKQKQFSLLVNLTRRNCIKDFPLSYWLSHKDILLRIVLDENGTLSLRGKKLWKYMRYNAAKVLAWLIPIREKLIMEFIHTAKYNISSRILVAKTLYDIGFTYFNKDFIIRFVQKSHDIFLKSMAVKTLTPISDLIQKTLLKLFHDEDDRVRILAVSRFMAKKSPYKGQLINQLLSLQKSQQERVRALAVKILWGYRFFRCYGSGSEKQMERLLPYLIKALNDSSETVRLAAFSNIKNVNSRYHLELQEVQNLLNKRLEQSRSPLIRYYSIATLASLGDKDILYQIIFNFDAPVIERIAAIRGLMNFKGSKKIGYNFIVSTVKKMFKQETSPLIRGIVLYSFSVSFRKSKKHSKNPLFRSLFFGVFEKLFSSCIQSKDQFLQLIATICLLNVYDIPGNILAPIIKIAKTSTNIELKTAALAVLVAKYHEEENDKSLRQVYKLMREYKYASYKAKYRMAKIWGYYQRIEFAINRYFPRYTFYLGLVTESHPKQKRYKQELRLQGQAKVNKTRAFYIRSLRKLIPIFLKVDNISNYEKKLLEKYTYQLVLLCNSVEKFSFSEKILKHVIGKHLENNGRLIALWGATKAQVGKLDEAIQQLEHSQKELPFSASIKKELAYLYFKKGQFQRAQKYAYLQYILSPENPSSLPFLGHYYCDRKKYSIAKNIFLEHSHHFHASNINHNMGLIRVYCISNDITKAIRLLRQSANYSCLLPKHLKYPEFKVLYNEKLYRYAISKTKTYVEE